MIPADKLGYYIKYQSEYNKSSYYKDEFEKSGLTIDEFYKKYIYIRKNYNINTPIPVSQNPWRAAFTPKCS